MVSLLLSHLIQLINSTADIHVEYVDMKKLLKSNEKDILKTGVEKYKRQWEDLLYDIYDVTH